jgi:copper chaperone CopZ
MHPREFVDRSTIAYFSNLSLFHRYRAMAVSDAEGPHVSRIHVILNGVHKSNRDYVSDRLCQEIDGLLSCRFIDSDDNRIELLFDSRRFSRFELLLAMQSFGYPAQLDFTETEAESGIATVQMRIEGMHCNSCVSNICAAVEDLPGAVDIKLTFEDKVATVIYDSRILNIDHIVTEIEKLGFKVAIANAPSASATTQYARGRKTFSTTMKAPCVYFIFQKCYNRS